MPESQWTNCWKTALLIKMMSRCLEVQADHKCMMINVTKHDALVPDEYIAQGSAEFGAELQKLMQDALDNHQELMKLKEEEIV